jgi:rRNA processing protein Gar1
MNEKILKIPYIAVREDWDLLQKFLELKGNPKYILVGDVNLFERQDIFDLGNLVGVEGELWLTASSIESLGELEYVDEDLLLSSCKKIKTLGKLKKVVGDLALNYSSVKSLCDLQFVGDDLYIRGTNIPQSELDNVEVVGEIRR